MPAIAATPGPASGGGRPRGDHVVDHDPRVRARVAYVVGDGRGVRARDRQHRRAELTGLYARPLDGLVGRPEERLDGSLGADRVLVAGAAVAHVKRSILQIQNRCQRLRGAAVHAHHVAGSQARLGSAEEGRELHQGGLLHGRASSQDWRGGDGAG